MEIVIEIPDELYEAYKGRPSMLGDAGMDMITQSIANGVPLPKGHGDLIDRKKIVKAIPAEEDNCTGMGMTYDEMDAYNDGIDDMYEKLQRVKPIIEADKEDKR